MIVSHKYKFIFIKAVKVAGTSVEEALAKYCGPEDHIHTTSEIKKGSRIQRNPLSSKPTPHEDIQSAKSMIPWSVWKSYLRVSVIRNPWDCVVSGYWWRLSKNQQNK